MTRSPYLKNARGLRVAEQARRYRDELGDAAADRQRALRVEGRELEREHAAMMRRLRRR